MPANKGREATIREHSQPIPKLGWVRGTYAATVGAGILGALIYGQYAQFLNRPPPTVIPDRVQTENITSLTRIARKQHEVVSKDIEIPPRYLTGRRKLADENFYSYRIDMIPDKDNRVCFEAIQDPVEPKANSRNTGFIDCFVPSPGA